MELEYDNVNVWFCWLFIFVFTMVALWKYSSWSLAYKLIITVVDAPLTFWIVSWIDQK